MSRFSNEMMQKDGNLIYPSPLSPFDVGTDSISNDSVPSSSSSSSSSSSFSRISPILLLVIVILAVIFFVSGLLHLLVRFLLKRSSPSIYHHSNRYTERPGSHTLQRQLQQLFRLHDSGLDQSFIDALPVFLYRDIMDLKEPFDCAVCLNEFSYHDRLRSLPICSHAFHINCIDTWLLSNSTCPLCRASLLSSNFPLENPNLDEILGRGNGSHWQPENPISGNHQKRVTTTIDESSREMRVFSVRLGKFKKINSEEEQEHEEQIEEEGESSNQNHLNARRCYSMGTYQYVVGDSDLQVMKEKLNPAIFQGNGEVEGKKISGRSNGESFSVSKIWQWSKKSGLPIPSSSNNQWRPEFV
ncbi:RING-H2 finger protein ATL46-like [Cucurbita moschata]|uniref:RING-type E3 ubiquitin transferase n=1 Tax=Cucurbita moschata TaxID=3662 RepID=A0A6J1GUG8_CUCMO|nr:RING-H2 finger protein ATL46-like [Cucurbita moschata]